LVDAPGCFEQAYRGSLGAGGAVAIRVHDRGEACRSPGAQAIRHPPESGISATLCRRFLLVRAAEDSQASETFAQLAERGLEHRDIATGRSAVQINERATEVHRGPGQFRRLEPPDLTAVT